LNPDDHTLRLEPIATTWRRVRCALYRTAGSAAHRNRPVNASIHQVNEHVNVADLEALPGVYRQLIDRLLLANTAQA